MDSRPVASKLNQGSREVLSQGNAENEDRGKIGDNPYRGQTFVMRSNMLKPNNFGTKSPLRKNVGISNINDKSEQNLESDYSENMALRESQVRRINRRLDNSSLREAGTGTDDLSQALRSKGIDPLQTAREDSLSAISQLAFSKKQFALETSKKNKNRHNFVIKTEQEEIDNDQDPLAYYEFGLRPIPKETQTFIPMPTMERELRDPYL